MKLFSEAEVLNNILNDDYTSDDGMIAHFMCELLSSKTFRGYGTIFLKSFVSYLLKLCVSERDIQRAGLRLVGNVFRIIMPCFSVFICVIDGSMSFALEEYPYQLNQCSYKYKRSYKYILLDDILEWLSGCMNAVTEDGEIPVNLYKVLSKFYDKLQNISDRMNSCPELDSDIGDYLGEKVLRAVKTEVLKFGKEYAINLDDYIRIGESGYMYARADKNSMWKLCFLFNHYKRNGFMHRREAPNFKHPNDALIMLGEESNFISFRDHCVERIIYHA